MILRFFFRYACISALSIFTSILRAQTVRMSEPIVGDGYFSPDGRHLISTSGQIFDLKTGRNAADLNYCGTDLNGYPTIFDAAWSSSGKYVLFNRRIFDGETLEQRFILPEKKNPKRHFAQHEKHFSTLKPMNAAAFSPDEKQLLAGDEIFEVATQKPIATLKPHPYKSGMAYLHFISDFSYNVRFIDVSIKGDFQPNNTHVLSPDLKYCISGESLKSSNFAFFTLSLARVHESYATNENRAEHTYYFTAQTKLAEDKMASGNSFSDDDVDFAENNPFVAIRDENTVKVYDLSNSKIIFTIEDSKNKELIKFKLSPSGKLLLLCYFKEAFVYDVQKKKKIYVLFDEKNNPQYQRLNNPFISPNEKYVINGENGNILDIKTGNLLGVMMSVGKVYNESATLNSENKTAVLQYSDGSSRIFDTNSGDELFVNIVQNLNTLLFTASSNGKWVASSDWEGKLSVWATNNPNTPLKSFAPYEGKLVTQILFDTLQNRLIINGMDGTIKIFSLQDFTLIHTFTTKEKNNRLLLAGTDILAIKHDEVKVYKQDGTLINTLILNIKPNNIAIYPPAQLLYSDKSLRNYYNGARVHNFVVNRKKAELSDKNKFVSGGQFYPEKLYTITTNQKISLWNFENGKVETLKFQNENPAVTKTHFDYALRIPTYGKVLGYGGAYIDLSRNSYCFPFAGINQALYNESPTNIGNDYFVSNDGKKVAVLNNKNKANIWNASLYDNTQNKLIEELKLPKGYSMDFTVVFSYTGDSLFALLRGNSYSLGIFDTQKGNFLKLVDLPFEGKNLLISPLGDWILACKEKNFIFFNVKSNSKIWEGDLPLSSYKYQLLASANGRYVVLRNFSNYKGSSACILDLQSRTVKLVEDLAFFTSFTADSRYLVSAMKDTKADLDYLIFYTLPDLQEKKLTALQIGIDNRAVFLTPEKYYMASKASIQDIHFSIGKNTYLFDQFDLRFNRPDIVLGQLGYASPEMIAVYKKAWEKRVRKAGFDPKVFDGQALTINTPEVKIEKPLPLTTSEPTVTVNFSAFDSQQPISKAQIYINGVPVLGRAGIEVSNSNQKTNNRYQVSISQKVVLTNGKNVIELSAINQQGIESVRERQEITYTPTSTTKPNLYVVAIGVSEFSDNIMNLTYAAKDAEDLVNILKSRTDLYENIYVQSFINSKATKANILKAKADLLNSKPDDKVIVFVASHGLLDKNLDYFIATTDVDFNNPSLKGLPYEELENLLDGIPARHKLMLIDACHSGEVDKDEENVPRFQNLANVAATSGGVKSRGFKPTASTSNDLALDNLFELMKELFADLRKGTGAIVISSASGKEFAFESEAWKNGVFTYSVLEGLKSMKADANQDQKITVSELRSYVIKRVTELSEGKQHPTSRTENLENDFKIW
ncbi:MAG: caspase family protein [Cytophagales bacterium]|nr:caspase family protein [Cytophagales bacterium]MDW8384382.1 caspase family protein [Flammeovirgaceae bacterium]